MNLLGSNTANIHWDVDQLFGSQSNYRIIGNNKLFFQCWRRCCCRPRRWHAKRGLWPSHWSCSRGRRGPGARPRATARLADRHPSAHRRGHPTGRYRALRASPASNSGQKGPPCPDGGWPMCARERGKTQGIGGILIVERSSISMQINGYGRWFKACTCITGRAITTNMLEFVLTGWAST